MDTNVVVDITKYKENLSLNDLQRERMAVLNETLYKLTRAGKLLYVEGDQREEINSLIKETHGTQSFLSLGIKFKYRKAIHDNQLYHFMKAYIKEEETVILNYRDSFYRDPIKELDERNKGHLHGLIVSVYSEVSDGEITERMKRKETIREQFESLRQKAIATGITYEQQLEREHTGIIQVCRTVIQNMEQKISNQDEITFEDYAQYAIFTDLISMWDDLGGNSKGLMEFLTSDVYKTIPYEDIKSRLFAKIITGTKAIESGDSMDVEHLSTVIPYCNYVVTDKKMKNRITQLGIDAQYNTKVYCLSETSELISELEKL
jgi:hypothetical protein